MTTAAASRRGDLSVAGALIGVLALTVVPLPALFLDGLLAFSLTAAVVTFLVAFYVDRPLDFSAFPSLLLFLTLFRLALNVASTRLILTNGGQGEGAVGGVIAAFGSFAVGGNFVVGAVVFMILVIINFIVITKGAERISEVSARFTLDSLPGKQMAIDADLGAGLITEVQARERRKSIEQEADFHGSMDGASKFVRGDAIAGLLILAINIVGGMIIGVAQQDLGFGEAVKRYTLLSIGDGLVSQIPALLIATGAALLTTRSSDSKIGTALGNQLLSRKRPLAIAAAVLGIVGLIPGMPHVAFLSLAGLAAFGASRASDAPAKSGEAKQAKKTKAPAPEANSAEAQKLEIERMLPVDLLSLEVGLDLLPMVDADRGGELLGRIASLRRQLAGELGLIVPPVHVRDDLRMRPGAYRVLVSGVSVGEGEVRARKMLAIDASGTATRNVPGEMVKEPTFGLPAKWVSRSERTRAEAVGCTVVDASAVIATHLTELIRQHGHELLGRREAQELLDIAAKHNSKVVEELIPHLLSLGDVIKVFRRLLREGVSLRDMRTILEALADAAGDTKDIGELTEAVRLRLGRRITRAQLGDAPELRAMVLSPQAEILFRSPEPANAARLSKLARSLEEHTRKALERDENAVLVVAPELRRSVAAVAERHARGLSVMSYREIDPSIPFITSEVIGVPEMHA